MTTATVEAVVDDGFARLQTLLSDYASAIDAHCDEDAIGDSRRAVFAQLIELGWAVCPPRRSPCDTVIFIDDTMEWRRARFWDRLVPGRR